MFCSNVKCYSDFLIIFELPIKVVSASLAISGFITLLHRSEQTRYQIEIGQNQNIFKNYVDHKKEFMFVLDSIESNGAISFTNKNTLYNNYFPYNTPKNIEFTSRGILDSKSKLLILINSHNELINEFNKIEDKYSLGTYDDNDIDLWLRSYLIITNIFISNNKNKICKTYEKHFNIASIDNLPSDINSYMNSINNALNELAFFCFPGNSISIISHTKPTYINLFITKFFIKDFTANTS